MKTLDASAVAAYAGPGKMAGDQGFPAERDSVDACWMRSPRARSCRCCCWRFCSGWRCSNSAARENLVFEFIEKLSHVLFAMVGIIMRAAPIGAFGAMAFTVGAYGIGSLLSLAKLMATFYLTCVVVHLRRARG